MYAKNHQPAPANVLLVGAGALGCAAARTLAAASAQFGAGLHLTLVDSDRVEPSNLQRQVLYCDSDVGRLKVEAAAERLAADFAVTAAATALHLDAAAGQALVAAHDIVIDGTDDPATKFLLNRLCVEAAVPLIHGGVARTGGQWMLVEPGVSACLQCVFAEHSPSGNEGCTALGILAPVAGVVGSMQAMTALWRLLRPCRARAGRLFVYEMARVGLRHVDFPRSADCFCSAREDRGTDHTGGAQLFSRRQAS